MSDKNNSTKTYVLKCLNEIRDHLNNKTPIKDINGHFNVIESYIEDIAKQRQDKRDLELKEIYSKVTKRYLSNRARLIERLKSLINENKLGCAEFLTGNKVFSKQRPVYYENYKPEHYKGEWVKKELIIQIPTSEYLLKLIIPIDGNPLELENPYEATTLKVEIFKNNLKVPFFSKEFKWSFSSMKSPWLVCNSILKRIYKDKSYHNPSEEFEGLMLQILHAYPKTRYHK